MAVVMEDTKDMTKTSMTITADTKNMTITADTDTTKKILAGK